MVLKIQREDSAIDPLHPDDLERDGGSDKAEYLRVLSFMRRLANLNEITFAIHHPERMPKQYGVLCSFGREQEHPSVIIAEAVTPLSHSFPIEEPGIPFRNIYIDDVTGLIHIHDPRLTADKPSAHFRNDDADGLMQLANLGSTQDGRYVFCDGSNYHRVIRETLNPNTLCPLTWEWWEWATPNRDLTHSGELFSKYKEAAMRGQNTTSTGTPGMYVPSGSSAMTGPTTPPGKAYVPMPSM